MTATTPGGESPNRFVYLLIALTAVIFAEAVLPPGTGGDVVQAAVFLLVAVVTVRALARRRWVMWTTTSLGVFGAIGSTISNFGHTPLLEVLGLGSVTVFMTFTAIIILGEVFRATEVAQDQIFGAICAYVLIGVGWASLYSTFHVLDPGAFSLPDGMIWNRGEGQLMTYFSFVTLTTLGYGDITPVGNHVRTLCWAEAVFGQIYLTVLVARLVSLQVTHAERKRSRES